jgi:hypothetical protein
MSENFRIRIRSEIGVAILNQLIFQRLIIFDDSVVGQGKPPTGVKMRMSIFIGHFAMGRPTGMADPERARYRFPRNQLGERGDSPRAFPRLDLMMSIDDGDAGRVIAAIFEAPKPIEQNRRRFRAPDITDNSAHMASLMRLGPAARIAPAP